MSLKDEILEELRNSGDFCSGQELCERFGVTRTAVWKAVSRLKEEGYQIEARQNRGYRLMTDNDVMNETELKEALKDSGFLQDVCYFRQIDSTNLEVKRRADQGAPGPLLIVADEQTAGRGRRGRSWSSPPGTSISMSLLLRPHIRPENASMLTLVCALAVAGGIAETTGLKTEIKWPNDVVIHGKKICGILTEMNTELGEIGFVVPGIGINVNMTEFPEEIRETATSLKLELGKHVPRTPVVAAFVRCFAMYYGIFLETEDLTALKPVYEKLLVNRDREVLVLDPAGEWKGVARGITATGELLVERSDGSTVEVRSGEVSVRGIYGYV